MNNKYSDFIVNRTIQEANYIIATKCTIRECAKKFKVSKTTVHRDMRVVLPKVNRNKYIKIDLILSQNFDEKHIRGGFATKEKYERNFREKKIV
jgi:putative DeoR family transcriptional regulator (stage III sporulation protein D)